MLRAGFDCSALAEPTREQDHPQAHVAIVSLSDSAVRLVSNNMNIAWLSSVGLRLLVADLSLCRALGTGHHIL